MWSGLWFHDLHDLPPTVSLCDRQGFNWAALCEKIRNDLSCCHTKRKTGVMWPRPSFGMTLPSPPQKKSKKLFFQKISKRSMSYQKKATCHVRMSFFWSDNDSGHKGPFHMTSPICSWEYSAVTDRIQLGCITEKVRLRTIGTFSHDAAHLFPTVSLCVQTGFNLLLPWSQLIRTLTRVSFWW